MFMLGVVFGLWCVWLHEGQAQTLKLNTSSVAEGSDVNMTCSWNENVNTVIWQRKTGAEISVIGALSDESNYGFESSKYKSQPEYLYSGLRSHSIILRNAEKVDEGRYKCKVQSGQWLYSSNLMGLKVIDSSSDKPTTDDVDKDQDNGEVTVAGSGVTESDGTAEENMMPLDGPNPQQMQISVGVIAGATVGGVVLLAVVGAILFILWKRRNQINEKDNIEGNNNPSLPSENETAVDLDEAGCDNVRRPYITPSPGTYESLQIPPQL